MVFLYRKNNRLVFKVSAKESHFEVLFFYFTLVDFTDFSKRKQNYFWEGNFLKIEWLSTSNYLNMYSNDV